MHHLWETSPAFAEFNGATILESGFSGLYLETPPVTYSNLFMDHKLVAVESVLSVGMAS